MRVIEQRLETCVRKLANLCFKSAENPTVLLGVSILYGLDNSSSLNLFFWFTFSKYLEGKKHTVISPQSLRNPAVNLTQHN